MGRPTFTRTRVSKTAGRLDPGHTLPHSSFVQAVPWIQQSTPTVDVERIQRLDAGVLRTLGMQAKLAIGKPNDPYEQEADRIAEQVMSTSNAAIQQPNQRKIASQETRSFTAPAVHELTHRVQQNDGSGSRSQINRSLYVGNQADRISDAQIDTEIKGRAQENDWSQEKQKAVALALKIENSQVREHRYDTWLDAVEGRKWKGDKNAEGSEVRENTFKFASTLRTVLTRIENAVKDGFSSAFTAIEGGFLESSWSTLSGIWENISEIALNLLPGVASILLGIKKLYDLIKIGRLYKALREGAQKLQGKADQKVNRRWWDCLVTGVQKIVKGALKIAALFTGPLAVGFNAAADIGDAIVTIGKGMYRGGKAIYKKLKGIKGKNRAANAHQLLTAGLAGETWALNILIAMNWRGTGVVAKAKGFADRLNPLKPKNKEMRNIPGLLEFNNAMDTAASDVRNKSKDPEAANSARIDFQLKLSELYGASEDSMLRVAIQENVANELRSFA